MTLGSKDEKYMELWKDKFEFEIEELDGRICDVCGKKIQGGMTNDYGDFYVCEDCFEQYMDKEYGKGKWKETEVVNGEYEEDGYGGFYLFLDDDGEWEGTGIYYTDWDE